MFDTLKTDATIKTDGDNLGGSRQVPFESGLYDFTIKLAYGSLSDGKAKALNLLLETDNGKELSKRLWLTSAEAKGCLNYYTDKMGNKKYMQGFEMANHLCLMTLGKELSEVKTENKTIMLYDYNQRKEVPTDVKMVMELLGKKVTAGVIKQTVNKRVKDPGSGEYVSITETKDENEIDKFFHFPSGLTITEAKAKMTEPKFKQDWKKKWEGVTKDKTDKNAVADPTKDTNANSTGASTQAFSSNTASASGSSLFGSAA